MAIRIETMEYRKSHGREPRGTGSWAFAFGGPDAEPWFTPGATTYTAAKKMAAAEARKRGATVAYALP